MSAEHDALLRFGPVQALGAAFEETGRLASATLGIIWRMVRGAVSLDNINGPITIAQYAMPRRRWVWPGSVLPGDAEPEPVHHESAADPDLGRRSPLYYLIEMIGSPVSERTMIAGQFVGMVLLVGPVGLAFYNDILHLVSS